MGNDNGSGNTRATMDFDPSQDETPDYGIDPLIAGDFLVEVKRAEIRSASAEGKFDSIQLGMEIVGATDPEHRFAVGASFADFVSLSPKVAFRIKQLLAALPIRVHSSDGRTAIDVSTSIGKRCFVRTTINDFNGRRSTRVDRYAKPEFFRGEVKSGQDKAAATTTAPATQASAASGAPAAGTGATEVAKTDDDLDF